MSLPSDLGLPAEMQLGKLDNSLPSSARSTVIKVQPSNISSVSSTFSTLATNTNTVQTYCPDFTMNSQTLNFDLPIPSQSSFIDSRFTTVSFNATLTCNTAGTGNMTGGLLRGSGASFFDRMTVTGQDGNILEDT